MTANEYERTLTIKCKLCKEPSSLRTFHFTRKHDMERYIATEYSKINGEKVYNAYCVNHIKLNNILNKA